jgi:hypothetical protein
VTDPGLNYFILGILVALLFGTQIFWARIAYNLVDRLMSRDFSEYNHVKGVNKPKVAPIKPTPVASIDPIAEENAKKANSILGL